MGKELTGYRGSGTGLENREKRLGIPLLIMQISTHSAFFFFFFLIAPSFNLEKAMATHPSTLASKIPWMEEPGRLQSMGSRRGGHDWATSLSPFTFMHWRRKWQSTPVFLPGEFQGRGAWWAAIYGVIQSRTRLKRLSSSSSSFNLPISLPQV